MRMTISNDQLPPLSPIKLTTSGLENLLPGLVAKYGEDMPMSVEISAASSPRTIFTEGDMGGSLDLGFNFMVDGFGTAVMLDVMDAASMWKVSLIDFMLYLQCESVNIL
jgi:hypothetical protein